MSCVEPARLIKNELIRAFGLGRHDIYSKIYKFSPAHGMVTIHIVPTQFVKM